MIEIEGLRKTYGTGDTSTLACRVDSLRIEDGEQVALIGRSDRESRRC